MEKQGALYRVCFKGTYLRVRACNRSEAVWEAAKLMFPEHDISLEMPRYNRYAIYLDEQEPPIMATVRRLTGLTG